MLMKCENLPRTAKLKTSGPGEPRRSKKLSTPRLCSVCPRPPAHTTINNSLLKKPEDCIQESSSCYRQAGHMGLCTHLMKESVPWEIFFLNAHIEAVGASVHPSTSTEVSQPLFQTSKCVSMFGSKSLHCMNGYLPLMGIKLLLLIIP